MQHEQSSQHHRRERQEGGFTLIEILMTMTVTVIGLAGLLSLHMTTLRGNRMAANSAEASTVAQKVVEELRTLSVDGPDGIVARYGALPFEDAAMDTEDGRTGTVYTPYLSAKELTSLSEDLILLRVEVIWADDGADPATVDERYKHQVTVEIVRTRQEAL